MTPANFGIGNRIGVTKLMANALIDGDFGGGFGGYAGGGVGRAWVALARATATMAGLIRGSRGFATR